MISDRIVGGMDHYGPQPMRDPEFPQAVEQAAKDVDQVRLAPTDLNRQTVDGIDRDAAERPRSGYPLP